MAEYISREAVQEILKKYHKGFWRGIPCYPETIRLASIDVDALPATDVVEVVRCKDCEYFADANGKDSGKPCGYGICQNSFGIRSIICSDDFCSFGKRREEDAVD